LFLGFKTCDFPFVQSQIWNLTVAYKTDIFLLFVAPVLLGTA
jgi:hypothetical protein